MNAAASFAGLPPFLAYFAVAIALLGAYCVVYVHLTPHRELALIRAGNQAAALAFGGSIVGFCLPLHAAISHSVSLLDCAIWGGVALVVQALVFVALRVVVGKLPERIANGEVAAGTFVAAVSIGVGLLNAASMTP